MTTDLTLEVLRLKGRFWLVETVEPAEGGAPGRAGAKPARYRVHLRHPDGREELGAFRRFRPGSPRLGHGFTTLEDGRPISWEIVDEQLARDDQGERSWIWLRSATTQRPKESSRITSSSTPWPPSSTSACRRARRPRLLRRRRKA